MGNSQSSIQDLRLKLQGLYLYGNTFERAKSPKQKKDIIGFLNNFIKQEKGQKDSDHNFVMLKYNVVKDKLDLPSIKTYPIIDALSRIKNNQDNLLHIQDRNKFQNLYLYEDTYLRGGTPVDEKNRVAFLKNFYDVEQNFNDSSHYLIMLKYNVVVDRLNKTKMENANDIEILKNRIQLNEKQIKKYEQK